LTGARPAFHFPLTRTVAAEDRLNYNEPPDWYYPTRESLGARGRHEEAEKVFRADPERNRASGRSLFGLWNALATQGKSAEAVRVEREFKAAWTRAEVQLKLEEFQGPASGCGESSSRPGPSGPGSSRV
jgi:hypothetical protein